MWVRSTDPAMVRLSRTDVHDVTAFGAATGGWYLRSVDAGMSG